MSIFKEYINALCISISKRNIRITPFSRIDRRTVLEGYNSIGRNSILLRSSVGYYTYLGNNCVFTNTVIGRFCSISSNVEMITGTHPSSGYASTHPSFFAVNTPNGKGFVEVNTFNEHKLTDAGRSLEIGNDVWIGAHVKILEGVKIGDGAIIATGSIVTKNVEPYTIVGGVPAKVIRYRFEEHEIKSLCEMKWWLWPIEKIKDKASLFNDVNKLIHNFD